jgi:hypothetical protein
MHIISILTVVVFITANVRLALNLLLTLITMQHLIILRFLHVVSNALIPEDDELILPRITALTASLRIQWKKMIRSLTQPQTQVIRRGIQISRDVYAYTPYYQ